MNNVGRRYKFYKGHGQDVRASGGYVSSFTTGDLTKITSSTSIYRKLMKEAKDSIPNFNFTFADVTRDFYFITDLVISTGSGYLGGAHNIGSQGGIGVKNKSTKGETDNELTTNELGHWLGLPHTFESKEYKNDGIVIKIHSNKAQSDKNFMDYDMPKRRKWYKIQLRNRY